MSDELRNKQMTVGELRDALMNYFPNTPVTALYDDKNGEGPVVEVHPNEDEPEIFLVVD